MTLRHRALASGAAHSAAIAREMPPARSFDQIFNVRWKHTARARRNGAQMWPILFPHTMAGRCIDGTKGEMVRAPTSAKHASHR